MKMKVVLQFSAFVLSSLSMYMSATCYKDANFKSRRFAHRIVCDGLCQQRFCYLANEITNVFKLSRRENTETNKTLLRRASSRFLLYIRYWHWNSRFPCSMSSRESVNGRAVPFRLVWMTSPNSSELGHISLFLSLSAVSYQWVRSSWCWRIACFQRVHIPCVIRLKIKIEWHKLSACVLFCCKPLDGRLNGTLSGSLLSEWKIHAELYRNW